MSRSWIRLVRRVSRILEIVFYAVIGLGILTIIGWLVVELLGGLPPNAHAMGNVNSIARCKASG